MSSSLRSLVKKQQQGLALSKYLGNNYDKTSEEMKAKLLEAADESIEKEVTSILSAFIQEALKDSPESKRRKSRSVLNLLTVIICTPSIAYGVNLENWVIVSLFSLILAIVQIYVIRNEF